MKDASPKVFRSLERQSHPDFDDVVTAAVAAFAALRHPTPRQSADLARLVLPLWEHASGDTLRNCAAALSHSERVPRGLVERFVAAPIEIAAPFLVSSPLLTDDDLARLAASSDERVRRLVASRALREGDTAPPAARRELEAPPLAPFELAEASDGHPVRPTLPTTGDITSSAAGVREALRRMVLGSRAAAARLTVDDLIQAAMERDAPLFHDRLAAMLEIDAETLARIAADDTGERLAVALRALDARAPDAMSILLLMKPRIGLDVVAFDAIGRYYAQLQPADCRRLVSGAASATPAPQPRAAARPRIEPVAEPRATFGRRAARPDDRSAKG